MTEKLRILSPYDESLISEVEMHDASQLEHALQQAHRLAQNPDERLSIPRRIEILEHTALLVQERSEEFALEAAREGGKPLIDSRVELDRAVQGILEAARSIPELTGREIPMNLTPSSQHRLAYTRHEPIGVVAAISAFNHPFNLIVHQVIPAVATGCPVIVKPALTTPLSCNNLVRCLYEAGLPEEWCQVMVCGNDVAEKLVTDPRVAFLSFIGSAKVGWSLRAKLAPGTRCALEHGGAAPVIVHEDADLDSMIPSLIKGGFYHAGQVCVSVQRVFVHESLIDDVTKRIVDAAQKLKVGDPTQDATEVGPLILPREADRVHDWVQEAEKAGGKILCGGEKIGTTCYTPTVLLDPPESARVSQEEIFGPVINLYSFKDYREAIDRANAIPYSFQAAVFTQNLDLALDTSNRLHAAAVMVNDHSAFRVDWMPFAGRKASGLGIGGIRSTMQEMLEEKMIVIHSKVL